MGIEAQPSVGEWVVEGRKSQSRDEQFVEVMGSARMVNLDPCTGTARVPGRPETQVDVQGLIKYFKERGWVLAGDLRRGWSMWEP